MNSKKLISLIFKTLSLAVINAMIAMTLVLSPIPFVGSGEVYAADSEAKCEEDTEGAPGIYKPGCDFNDDLAKADLKDHYPEGVVGIVEQLIGAVFGLIGLSAIYVPYPMSVKDCSTHQGAAITMPIIMGGSLSYLLGEVAANNEFKKGSKIAVDKNFQAKKSEVYDRTIKNKDERNQAKAEAKKIGDGNDKQVSSYEALESIYGHQVSGMEKKIQLATVAEAAFLTAEGIELSDLSSNTTLAEADEKALIALDIASREVLFDLAIALVSASTVTNPSGSLACVALESTLSKYLIALATTDVEKFAVGNAEAAINEAETQSGTSIVSASLLNPFVSMAGGSSSSGVVAAQIAKEKSLAGANDATKLGIKKARAAIITLIGTEITACSSFASTNGVGTAVLPILSSIWATVTEIETQRALPLFCKGATSIIPADLDSAMPIVSQLRNKIDNYQLTGSIGSLKKDFFAPETMFFVENILNNLYHRVLKEKVLHENLKTPAEEISKLAAASEYADFLTKEALIKMKSLNMEEEFYKMFPETKESNINFNYEKYLAKIKTSILSSANADGFMELLNLAVKVGVLYYFLNMTVKNYAFPKPWTRAVTWGIMATVNGAIIAFDQKAKKEASKRLNIVKREKERFIKSHAIKSGIDLTKDIGGELNIRGADLTNLKRGGKGIIACAEPNGNSFAPAACPTKLRPASLKVPLKKAKFLPVGGVLRTSASLVTGVARSAAQGDQLLRPEFFDAKFDGLASNRQALIKKVEGLRNKLDSQPKIKNKNGKEIPRTSLKKINTKFKKLYQGDATKTGITNDQASQLSSLKLPDLEKLKKLETESGAKVSSFKAPSFSMPSSNKGAFDFDVDSGDGVQVQDVEKPAGEEQSLQEFVVNTEEINENENVDIFKLISNRHLIYYPVLLERK